jgi:hypothetical protein
MHFLLGLRQTRRLPVAYRAILMRYLIGLPNTLCRTIFGHTPCGDEQRMRS